MGRSMVPRVKDNNPLDTRKTLSLDFDEEKAVRTTDQLFISSRRRYMAEDRLRYGALFNKYHFRINLHPSRAICDRLISLQCNDVFYCKVKLLALLLIAS